MIALWWFFRGAYMMFRTQPFAVVENVIVDTAARGLMVNLN